MSELRDQDSVIGWLALADLARFARAIRPRTDNPIIPIAIHSPGSGEDIATAALPVRAESRLVKTFEVLGRRLTAEFCMFVLPM
jgi:hypothetical protein